VIRNILKSRFNKDYRALKRLSKKQRYTNGEVRIKGFKYSFPDARSFVFMYKELFEKQIYKFKANTNSPYIIDCGANIGMGILYFKQIYPETQVLAFEPEKSIYNSLRKNLKDNNINNVEIVSKAVWKEEAILSFLNEGADANRIEMLGQDENLGEKYLVEAIRLSKYIDREVDLLKMDIEGAELEVLKEIEPKMNLIKNIFIEYHSFSKQDQRLDELLNILSRNEFRYYIDSPNGISNSPFINRGNFLSMDFFLNIYCYRD